MTLDHITPLTKRGSCRSKENAVVACRECNTLKGQLELSELADLSPESLAYEFQNVARKTAERKGHYAEWTRNAQNVVA